MKSNYLFDAIDFFCKKADIIDLNNQKPTTPPKYTSTVKDNVEYRDRFHGTEGEERAQLIQDEAKKKGFTLTQNKITPLSANDVKNGLTKLITDRFKEMTPEMTSEFVYTLMAQIKLETGMRSSHNWNVGNIHAIQGAQNQYWKGLVSAWNDPQIAKGGGKYTNVDWFWRAYATLEEGLGDYYLLLEKKFPKAIEYAKQGDAYNFGLALGNSGYYTANKQTYSKGLEKIKQQYKNTPTATTTATAQ